MDTVLYSPDLGDLILGLYVEGMSLSQICRIDGMPALGTVLRWLKDQTKFVDGLDGARRARALLFEDRAIEVLDEHPGTMAEVTWAGKRFDSLMKLTEVNDPVRYGKKVTVGGDKDRPIVFRVLTGVPAPALPHIELNADGTIKGAGSSEVERGTGVAHPTEVDGSSPSLPTTCHPVHKEAQLE